MSVQTLTDHQARAEGIVEAAHQNGGLAPMDLDAFWDAQDKTKTDPWTARQLPLGMQMSHEAVFDELGLEEDWYRLHHDAKWRYELITRFNDIAETTVGRRVLNERAPSPADHAWPRVKPLHEIFEAKEEWHSWSYWIHPSAHDEDELASLLDRVEARLDNLREFILPDNWDEEKARLQALGLEGPIYRSQRGPVTFATSIYGVENLIYLLMDEEKLAARFRDLIIRATLERAKILDEERGWPAGGGQRGWYWCDDNCCLLNKELYDQFGKPILKAVYDQYAPDPADLRGQHSDSDMAQHLPTFAELDMNSVNFGPTLTIQQIRDALPHAVIHGQLAPFTLSRNEEVNIVAETLRDIYMARQKRGVVFATAGSINNGSRLSAMRLIMATIQQCGQFE